jgi:hypothetical protein
VREARLLKCGKQANDVHYITLYNARWISKRTALNGKVNKLHKIEDKKIEGIAPLVTHFSSVVPTIGTPFPVSHEREGVLLLALAAKVEAVSLLPYHAFSDYFVR